VEEEIFIFLRLERIPYGRMLTGPYVHAGSLDERMSVSVQVPNFALVLISLINVFVTCEKATRDY